MREVTDAEFDALLNGGGKIVVDFFATWCAPCRVIAPTLERVAKERPDITFVKLNVDEQMVAVRYNVGSLPTLIMFNGGEEVSRRLGIMIEPELREWLRTV